MHLFAFLTSTLLSASAALALPLAVRQTDATTFRFLGSVYCLIPTVDGVTSGPCPVENQVVIPFNNNSAAVVEVLGHSVDVTKMAASIFMSYNVTIDGVLRTPAGQTSPTTLFGPGIMRSYDFPLDPISTATESYE